MPDVDSSAMRQGGADVLSLALMDARNHTLHLISQFDAGLSVHDSAAPSTNREISEFHQAAGFHKNSLE